MRNQLKSDFRAAVDIGARLQSSPPQGCSLAGLHEAMAQCERWQRSLSIAATRNWSHSARDSLDRLRGAIDVLRMRSRSILDDLTRQPSSEVQPSASAICQDLRSLRDEFEMVTVDRARKRLTVRTSDIVLEDVYLGSFDIQLDWEYITGSSPYHVVATDANPARTDDSTTHPHVQVEKLCEGEGTTMIRRALSEGRLFDFFCIVDRILRSYNPHSAYVSLSDWEGVNCHDCGGIVSSDDVASCAKCENEVCGECSRSCYICSDRYCDECVSSCSSCDEDCCQTCLQPCDGCGESFCKPCLFEGSCDDCIDQRNEEEAKRQAEAEPSAAPLHPVCVGETVVSA